MILRGCRILWFLAVYSFNRTSSKKRSWIIKTRDSHSLQSQSKVQFIFNMSQSNVHFEYLLFHRYGKFRTIYYSTLAKLLIMDMKEETSKFDLFMAPFKQSFDKLELAVTQGPFDTPQNRELVIHLARDLRGVVLAVMSVESYNMLFNWLVNRPKQPGASRVSPFNDNINSIRSDRYFHSCSRYLVDGQFAHDPHPQIYGRNGA